MKTGAILSDHSWSKKPGLMDEFEKLQQSMAAAHQDQGVPKTGPRSIRVVQVGKKGADGHASISPPRRRPVACARAEGYIPASSSTSSSQRRLQGDRRPRSQQESSLEEPTVSSIEYPSTQVSSKREGHNLFSVGYNEPKHPARGPEPLLPYVPRRPQDVCKTYNHIFKLLNDPFMSKHVGGGKQLPKQKQAVHVSMPRLPSAGAS